MKPSSANTLRSNLQCGALGDMRTSGSVLVRLAYHYTSLRRVASDVPLFFAESILRVTELACGACSMVRMALLAGPQLATTAFSEDDTGFQATILTQEEPGSHATRSDGAVVLPEASPKSLISPLFNPQVHGVLLARPAHRLGHRDCGGGNDF